MFVCGVCGQRFQSQSWFDNHLRLWNHHPAEPPWHHEPAPPQTNPDWSPACGMAEYPNGRMQFSESCRSRLCAGRPPFLTQASFTSHLTDFHGKAGASGRKRKSAPPPQQSVCKTPRLTAAQSTTSANAKNRAAVSANISVPIRAGIAGNTPSSAPGKSTQVASTVPSKTESVASSSLLDAPKPPHTAASTPSSAAVKSANSDTSGQQTPKTLTSTPTPDVAGTPSSAPKQAASQSSGQQSASPKIATTSNPSNLKSAMKQTPSCIPAKNLLKNVTPSPQSNQKIEPITSTGTPSTNSPNQVITPLMGGPKKQSAKCHFCPMYFATSAEVIAHGNKEHVIRCRFCPKFFPTIKAVMAHKAKEHSMEKMAGTPALKCVSCPTVFDSVLDLMVHRQKKHNYSSLQNISVSAPKCHLCRLSFGSHHELVMHNVAAHSEARSPRPLLHFECSHCDASFAVEDLMVAHLRAAHNVYNPVREIHPFICEFCRANFSSEQEKEAHERQMHGGGESFLQCWLCPEMFFSMHELQQHEVLFHNDESFMCAPCGLQFDSIDQLDFHQWEFHCETPAETSPRLGEAEDTTHPRQPGDVKCRFCPAYFPSYQAVLAHKRAVHDAEWAAGVTQPRCFICGLKLNTKSEVMTHRKEVHGNAAALEAREGIVISCSLPECDGLIWESVRDLKLRSTNQDLNGSIEPGQNLSGDLQDNGEVSTKPDAPSVGTPTPRPSQAITPTPSVSSQASSMNSPSKSSRNPAPVASVQPLVFKNFMDKLMSNSTESLAADSPGTETPTAQETESKEPEDKLTAGADSLEPTLSGKAPECVEAVVTSAPGKLGDLTSVDASAACAPEAQPDVVPLELLEVVEAEKTNYSTENEVADSSTDLCASGDQKEKEELTEVGTEFEEPSITAESKGTGDTSLADTSGVQNQALDLLDGGLEPEEASAATESKGTDNTSPADTSGVQKQTLELLGGLEQYVNTMKSILAALKAGGTMIDFKCSSCDEIVDVESDEAGGCEHHKICYALRTNIVQTAAGPAAVRSGVAQEQLEQAERALSIFSDSISGLFAPASESQHVESVSGPLDPASQSHPKE